MKKFIRYLLLVYLLFPISVIAYSDYLIASGKNIGIELKSNNIIIVGSYKVNDHNILDESDLRIGDKIIKIDNYEITSAASLQNTINKLNKDNIDITYKRNNEELTTNINLYQEDGEYKTGLYVRDSIRGVATLTYIDKSNNTFGALGHEILEKSTKSEFAADSGSIFASTVTGITKSTDGNPGEKNAQSNIQDKYGNVKENTTSGIFGDYTAPLPNSKLYKVAKPEDIKLGKAKILTVLEGDKVEAFDINIIKINHNSKTKNILFEVTDEKLIDIAGGIVQGMSGSPIIQDDYIIGAVNFVVVDRINKGYGIFITTMLEEAEN